MAFTYQYITGDASKINQAIDHLIQLQDPTKIIESQSGYEAIFLIAKYIAYQTNSISYDVFVDRNMHVVFGNVLYRLYEINSTYDFSKDKISATEPTSNANYNEKCITDFCMVTYSCNLIMSNSLRFKLAFQKTKGLEAILKMLKDQNFLGKNLNLSMNPFNSAVLFIIDYLTLNLSSLSISCQEFKDLWNDLDSVNVLLNVAKKRNTAREYCYNTILNVANDKQLETLAEIQNYSKDLEKKVETIANDFRNDRYDRQTRQILNENGVTKVNIHCLKDSNNIYTSYIVVFNGLYNLSVNEKIKIPMYFGSKNNYKVILNKGNEWEKHYCLRLMSQLSLSEHIANDLKIDTEFLGILETMINSNNPLFKKFCEQIKWNLKDKPKEEEIVQQKQQQVVQQSTTEPAKTNSHIMISYNTASRELCLSIKEKLESFGYRVWIDVNDIHGSSLDSMARAVEDSFCVLMCVTEKYRQSVNCQAEAQYAFRINKPIIPLIMQKGYESVSGWLGIIMGDKIFVNFMKYSFDECIKRLKNEVESKLSSNQHQAPVVNNSGVATSSGKNNPETMTQDEIKQWFSQNGIDAVIVNYLNSCDGLVLKQLFEMKNTNPQFYDQSLSKLENINMMAILKFNAALEKLFN